ncbi:MAG: site-specific integrase [Proteobacteria bacterium]|nr:site-specific integrase [Pseudomonadota bacterium]
MAVLLKNLPRFFAALAEEPNETIRDYILLSILTGARRSNLLAMKWEEISWERAEWRIHTTKNEDPQTVTLSEEAMVILERRRPSASSEYVFPGSGRTGHLVEPKKGWRRVLGDAEINNLRMHDLRRTLGSWQAKTGASLTIIGKSLNHKSLQATAIYARLDLDPVRESVEKATNAILTAAGLKQAD